jgi:hypothetical protein
MAKIKKPPIPVWLSTHPSDEDRVRKLREFLPEAQKYYSEAREKYGVGVPLGDFCGAHGKPEDPVVRSALTDS